MTSPFFIVGSGRSGTTMIRRLLSRHSLLCVPEETHFISKMYKPFVRRFRRGKLQEAVNLLNDLPLVKKWGVSISENELSGNNEKEFYANAISLLMNKKSQKEGKQFWGDKTPSYVLEIQFLSELYPDARFINIYRDGRDVALSVMPLSWGPNNAYASAVWYNRAIASWNDAANKISIFYVKKRTLCI